MEDVQMKDVKSNVIYITGFPNEFTKSEFQGKHIIASEIGQSAF